MITDIDRLRQSLSLDNEEMEKNIGRMVRWCGHQPTFDADNIRGAFSRYQVLIVGVQRIWDWDNGIYRSGCPGYTVIEQNISADWDGSEFIFNNEVYERRFACSPNELIF